MEGVGGEFCYPISIFKNDFVKDKPVFQVKRLGLKKQINNWCGYNFINIKST